MLAPPVFKTLFDFLSKLLLIKFLLKISVQKYFPWMLALLPWIWIIPFNQYFWDDWAIAENLGWQDQIEYWGSRAKHFGNPVVFFLLISIGPWIFHALIIAASILGAFSLSRIISQIPIANQLCVRWSGPLFLVMPVFHARFSIATFEYSLALAGLLSAWALLVNRDTLLTKISAIVLLIYAIGVPSLAIMFPFVWLHMTLLNTNSKSLRDNIAAGIRALYVLAIPAVFSIFFIRFVNTEGKYRVSQDGLIDWGNDFFRLLSGTIFFILLTLRFRRRDLHSWLIVLSTLHLIYLALFPYFAVGYKPLYDLQPWTMRDNLRDEFLLRLTLPLFVLSVAFAIAYAWHQNWVLGKFGIFELLSFSFAILFGAISIGFGPMDWESRHWLVAWPSLVVFALSLVSRASQASQKSLFVAMFAVFLTSSLLISVEYFVDTLKQRSLVNLAEEELDRFFQTDLTESSLIVLKTEESTEKLNARFRSYRSYEWEGIINQGLNRSSRPVTVQPLNHFRENLALKCPDPIEVVLIEPKVRSSVFIALTQFKVDATFSPTKISLCFSQIHR